MPKYYVENREIKSVVDCKSPLKACVMALKKKAYDPSFSDKQIKLDLTFFVSEIGFISDRKTFNINKKAEGVIDTKAVLNSL